MKEKDKNTFNLDSNYGYLVRNKENERIFMYKVPFLSNSWLNINLDDKVLPFNVFLKKETTAKEYCDMFKLTLERIYPTYNDCLTAYRGFGQNFLK